MLNILLLASSTSDDILHYLILIEMFQVMGNESMQLQTYRNNQFTGLRLYRCTMKHQCITSVECNIRDGLTRATTV